MRSGPKPLPLLERFRRSLRVGGPNDCWLWGRRTDGRGLGHVRIADDAGGRVYVHRLAYERAHGSIPPGLDVLHHCDVPRCCNPAHLFLGTFGDNMADKLRKGRQAKGERAGMARLTEAQVRDIRAKADLMLQRDLAQQYSVRPQAISRIINRRRWAHLDAATGGSNAG